MARTPLLRRFSNRAYESQTIAVDTYSYPPVGSNVQMTMEHTPSQATRVIWPDPRWARRDRVEFAAVPAAVRQARHWTAKWLAEGEPPPDVDAADTVVLLVSELVTNAVQAVEIARAAQDLRGRAGLLGGPATISLVLTQAPGCLRIEVQDFACAPLPVAPSRGCEDEAGRGLAVVDALATRWGWQPSPFGKVVWSEIDA
jgi:hypothetical protein